MQFDQADAAANDCSLMQSIKSEFEQNEIKMPQLVFWNVRYAGNIQMTTTDTGWISVSGFSPNILKYIINLDKDVTDITHKLIQDIVQSERYSCITI